MYKVYYAILPSNIIQAGVGPGQFHTPLSKLEKEREKYIENLNKKNGFYQKLEQSILQEGFRNPILVNAGFCKEVYKKYLPKEAQEDHTKILACDSNGGSRLYIAKKHNLDIPCLISDFVGRFVKSGFEELKTKEEILQKYKDKPKDIIFSQSGLQVSHLPQSHL